MRRLITASASCSCREVRPMRRSNVSRVPCGTTRIIFRRGFSSRTRCDSTGAAIKADPRIGEARLGEALALVRLRRFDEARDRLIEAARLLPDRPEFPNALARLYAAAPDARVRDGDQALRLAQQLTGQQQTLSGHEAMAMALAESGRYDEAARWQRDTINAAQRAGLNDVVPRLLEDLRHYELRQPSRTPWHTEPEWDEQ